MVIGNFFSWLLYLFDIFPSLFVCLLILALTCFLTLYDALGSSCIFHPSILELVISLRRSGYSYWKNGIRNQWALCVFIATSILLLLGPLSWQSKEIYVHANLCMYIYPYLYSCICVCVHVCVCTYIYTLPLVLY